MGFGLPCVAENRFTTVGFAMGFVCVGILDECGGI